MKTEQAMRSKKGSRKSVTKFINTVVDRVFGGEPLPVEKRMQNLAHKQANIRAASVRHGFEAMRARNEEMASRLEHYRQLRTRKGVSPPIDPPATEETIVLSAGDGDDRQDNDADDVLIHRHRLRISDRA